MSQKKSIFFRTKEEFDFIINFYNFLGYDTSKLSKEMGINNVFFHRNDNKESLQLNFMPFFDLEQYELITVKGLKEYLKIMF